MILISIRLGLSARLVCLVCRTSSPSAAWQDKFLSAGQVLHPVLHQQLVEELPYFGGGLCGLLPAHPGAAAGTGAGARPVRATVVTAATAPPLPTFIPSVLVVSVVCLRVGCRRVVHHIFIFLVLVHHSNLKHRQRKVNLRYTQHSGCYVRDWKEEDHVHTNKFNANAYPSQLLSLGPRLNHLIKKGQVLQFPLL